MLSSVLMSCSIQKRLFELLSGDPTYLKVVLQPSLLSKEPFLCARYQGSSYCFVNSSTCLIYGNETSLFLIWIGGTMYLSKCASNLEFSLTFCSSSLLITCLTTCEQKSISHPNSLTQSTSCNISRYNSLSTSAASLLIYRFSTLNLQMITLCSFTSSIKLVQRRSFSKISCSYSC